MIEKTYKVQAVAELLQTTVDTVRRQAEDAGLNVTRQASGPRTRQFSLANVYDLAAWRHQNARKKVAPKKRLVATIYAPRGGVGKTTIAANLACLFPLMGLRTIIVDLDFQANLTLGFGYDSELTREDAEADNKPVECVIDYHFGNLLKEWPKGRSALRDVLKKPFGDHGPHLIPADLTLDRLDTILTFQALEGKKADVIIAALIEEGLSGKNPDFDLTCYDVILFDAAPAKNRITKGAVLASDYVISPTSMEKFSTKAVSYLSTVLGDMHEDMGRAPELMVIGNFYTANRMRVINQMSMISAKYPGSLLDAVIRRSEEFPKALSAEMEDLPPLVLAKPFSDPANELRAVASEILVKTGVF